MENEKQQHTPEPWAYEVDKRNNISVILPDGKRIITGRITSDDCGHPKCCRVTEHANAERIVACVNACAGIEDPAKFIRDANAYLNGLDPLRYAMRSLLDNLKQEVSEHPMPAFISHPRLIELRAQIALLESLVPSEQKGGPQC